jgi:hypothetical protein
VDVEAGVAAEPVVDHVGLVGGAVVADHVDVHVVEDHADPSEESAKISRALPGPTTKPDSITYDRTVAPITWTRLRAARGGPLGNSKLVALECATIVLNNSVD